MSGPNNGNGVWSGCGRTLNLRDRDESGKYARQIKSWLVAIMYGPEEHGWAKIVPEPKERSAVAA